MSENTGVTLVGRVMESVRGRKLAGGTRLPSIRRMAEQMGVSKSTVVEAYDRLVADGTLTARRGSGFYAAARPAPLSLAEIGPRLDRAVDPLWIMRQSLEAGGPVIKPGCGWLPEDWMPGEAIQRALRAQARSAQARSAEGGLVEYGPPLGFAPLRQFLSRRLAERGIDAAPNQILLADSGTQALDLLCRFLVQPGDTVLVDDPCYFNFQAVLRAQRVRMVGVPHTPNGPDLAAFEQAAREHRPRLYVTNAAIHNPTGASLSPTVAHRLLKLAESHDMIVVEDDIFADFETEPTPRLAAFDGFERVVHIGSFSKTLSASLRCGFIAARPDWIEGLTDLKLATSFGNGDLAAQLVHRMLTDGGYRRHMEEVRGRLARAMAETIRRLRACGLEPWTEPSAGMFLWATLPEGLDSTGIAQKALSQGVMLGPGNVFSISQSASRQLRFNVAQSASPRIFEVLRAAMRNLI